MLPQRSLTVISLNNLGCSLLERNCHLQAHQTLHDAVLILKQSCANDLQIPPDQDSTSLQYIEAKLHDAERRLIHSMPSRISLPLTSYSSNLKYPCFRSVLQDSSANTSSSCYHPIRIEVNDASDLEKMESDVLSSIVLYNFAIASLCKAKLCCTGTVQLDGIVRVLAMVNNILRHCQNQHQVLFVAIASHDAIVKTLTEAGHTREAELYATRLASLVRAAEVLLMVEDVGLPEAAPAA